MNESMNAALYALAWVALGVALAWLNLKSNTTWLKSSSLFGCLGAFAAAALTLLGVMEVPR